MSDHTSDSAPTKECSKCGKSYPATTEYFYAVKRGLYGLRGDCKKCFAKVAKTWRQSNPDAQREIDRRNYWRHHEHRLLKAKQWRECNRERSRRTTREYHRLHPEKWREWRKNNPERMRAISNRRTARKRDAEGTYTVEDIQKLGNSQGWRCWYCQADCKVHYHIEHRVPLSRGGTNWPNNLAISCPACNRSKSDKLPHEWGDRLL